MHQPEILLRVRDKVGIRASTVFDKFFNVVAVFLFVCYFGFGDWHVQTGFGT